MKPGRLGKNLNQRRRDSMNEKTYQDKPLPSVELSLKFMSWDVKKQLEQTGKIVGQLEDLNNNFKILIGILRTNSSPNGSPPF